MTSDEPPDLADLVRELTQTHVHREHFTLRKGHTWYGQDHVTTVPALIDQLLHAEPSSNADDRTSSGYGSRPTARLEALDCLIHIDLQASRWIRDLGEDDPGDTIACIRKLHSLMPSAHQVTRDAVTKDVRHWWTQARIVSGWDSPAWRPDNTCPLCATRGGLRVKLADQTGCCVECGELWPAETIGFLADHIRSENAEHAEHGTNTCEDQGRVVNLALTGSLCPDTNPAS